MLSFPKFASTFLVLISVLWHELALFTTLYVPVSFLAFIVIKGFWSRNPKELGSIWDGFEKIGRLL